MGRAGMGRARKSKAAANGARMCGRQRNDVIVARNMRRFRIARGLTQTELGDAVGVTFQQIQKYEKAKVDGEPIPAITQWSCRTLIALNKIKSESMRRSIGALIEQLAGGQYAAIGPP